MSATTQVLCDYIYELQEDRRRLNKQLADKEDVSVDHQDVLKALHDASNVLGLDIRYQIADPAFVAVQFINRLVERAK